jgi:hypothetical protein
VRSAAAFCLVICFIAAGCGGSSSAKEGPDATTLEALWRAPGADVAIVPGTTDFAPGNVRLTFLVIDGQGRVVTRPTAKVWLARGLKAKPFAVTTAHSEQIGVPGGETADVAAIFMTRLAIEKPGTYWVLAEPVGGRRIQALGNVVVRDKPVAPAVGDPAIPTDTPTLANATIKQLTTSKVPDPGLYRSSVKAALAAKVPFVVTFATPAYCTSRTCGPVVDVLSTVRKRHAASKVRFIHVEVYKGNDPTKGENQWFAQWHLPSEPWTFLVGPDGKIRERFEGTVSVRELDAAVKKYLLS